MSSHSDERNGDGMVPQRVGEIDLTEAVEAAAKAMFEANEKSDWGDAAPIVRFNYRVAVLPAVTAAAPFIARQAWRQGRDLLPNPYPEEEQ